MIQNYQESGIHLIIDGFNISKEMLMNKELMNEVLTEIPKLIKATPLTKPVIFSGLESNPGHSGLLIFDESQEGLIGNVVLNKSHTSMHTLVKLNSLGFDLYSCMEFDIYKIMEYIIKKYSIADMNIKIIKRLGIPK